MSAAQYLTGVPEPSAEHYGPPRVLQNGRPVRFSTFSAPSKVHRHLAAQCLIGAIADPDLFWRYCRDQDLKEHQVRALAKYAQIGDYGDQSRINGLILCAQEYGLRQVDVLTLRLWW